MLQRRFSEPCGLAGKEVPSAYTALLCQGTCHRRGPLSLPGAYVGVWITRSGSSYLWSGSSGNLCPSHKVSWLRSPKKCLEDPGGPREVTLHPFMTQPVRAGSRGWIRSDGIFSSCHNQTSQSHLPLWQEAWLTCSYQDASILLFFF